MSLLDESVTIGDRVRESLGSRYGVIGARRRRGQSVGTRRAVRARRATRVDLHAAARRRRKRLADRPVHTGPAVIVFYRGEWCPLCNLHLRAFEKALPKLRALGATLIAICPEKPDYGQLLADEQQLTFPVLSDLGNAVARRYGLVFQIDEETKELFVGSFSNDLAERNGDDSWELPVPATFVVDASGIIRFAHVDADYLTGRADPEEVLGVLRTLHE